MCTSDHPRSLDVYQRSHYIARCVPAILHIAMCASDLHIAMCASDLHLAICVSPITEKFVMKYRYCTSIMVEKLSSSLSPAISLSLLHQRSSYRYQSSYYSSDLPIAIMPAIFLSLLCQRSSYRYYSSDLHIAT